MPPNISDGYVIFKPHEQWPDPSMEKEQLVEKIRATVSGIPGNLYEFSQPIELRITELVAGVRGDLAVKVFGDDFEKFSRLSSRSRRSCRRFPVRWMSRPPKRKDSRR